MLLHKSYNGKQSRNDHRKNDPPVTPREKNNCEEYSGNQYLVHHFLYRSVKKENGEKGGERQE